MTKPHVSRRASLLGASLMACPALGLKASSNEMPEPQETSEASKMQDDGKRHSKSNPFPEDVQVSWGCR